MAEKHQHDFKPRLKKVLLARYRNEEGEMKYTGTVGSDTLKQLVCTCGEVTTLDMVRTVVYEN